MHSTKRVHTNVGHHPRVRQSPGGSWVWACSCGGASCRTGEVTASWRQAIIAALNHTTALP